MNTHYTAQTTDRRHFWLLAILLLGLISTIFLVGEPKPQIFTYQLMEFVKSMVAFLKARSIAFYLSCLGLFFFSLPTAILLLVALKKGQQPLSRSIGEEATYWQSYTPE